MSEDLYKTLGVNKKSSKADIKKQYIKKAKILHPDNGKTGSKEKFQALIYAKEILSDPLKRKLYNDGNLGDGTRFSRAKSVLINNFMKLIGQDPGVVDKDIFLILSKYLIDAVNKMENIIENLEKENEKILKIRSRIKNKEGEDNIFIKALDSNMDGNDIKIEQVKEEIMTFKLAQNILKEYKYLYPKASINKYMILGDFAVSNYKGTTTW